MLLPRCCRLLLARRPRRWAVAPGRVALVLSASPHASALPTLVRTAGEARLRDEALFVAFWSLTEASVTAREV